MRDETLLEVTRVADDSTGIWSVDEVEFSIHCYALEKFLLRTGEKGAEEIRMTLKQLADSLESYMPGARQPADELTAQAQEGGLYDDCPSCGASLADCHIGDAACPECGRAVSDGGEEVTP